MVRSIEPIVASLEGQRATKTCLEDRRARTLPVLLFQSWSNKFTGLFALQSWEENQICFRSYGLTSIFAVEYSFHGTYSCRDNAAVKKYVFVAIGICGIRLCAEKWCCSQARQEPACCRDRDVCSAVRVAHWATGLWTIDHASLRPRRLYESFSFSLFCKRGTGSSYLLAHKFGNTIKESVNSSFILSFKTTKTASTFCPSPFPILHARPSICLLAPKSISSSP